MGFDELLGNDRLKQNLTGSLARGRFSHFYLISGPAGSGKKTLARLLAAAALCAGSRKPCLQCSHCRKVMAGTHPDFITVDDPEKRYVPIDLVRSATADMYIQPNEAERKIYMFPRAQDMQIPSQNALLKILEEPPAYGVFFLLTDNANKMLPTVRSRCTARFSQASRPCGCAGRGKCLPGDFCGTWESEPPGARESGRQSAGGRFHQMRCLRPERYAPLEYRLRQ